jgi:hypothetical protein
MASPSGFQRILSAPPPSHKDRDIVGVDSGTNPRRVRELQEKVSRRSENSLPNCGGTGPWWILVKRVTTSQYHTIAAHQPKVHGRKPAVMLCGRFGRTADGYSELKMDLVC